MAAFDLNPPITFVNSFGAIVLAHVFYNTTIVLRLVGDFWSRLDPRQAAAARALGASPARAFREVTLPLLAPALGAAALLVFLFDFTSLALQQRPRRHAGNRNLTPDHLPVQRRWRPCWR
jgi:thiamine transport system permease protein